MNEVRPRSVFDLLPQVGTVVKITLVALLISALTMIPVSHLVLQSSTLLYVSSSIAAADLLLCLGWILKSLCRSRDRSVIAEGKETLTPSPSALSIQTYSQEETKKRIFLSTGLNINRDSYARHIPTSSKFKNIFASELTYNSSFRIFEGDGSLYYPVNYLNKGTLKADDLEADVPQLLILVPNCKETEVQRESLIWCIAERCYSLGPQGGLNPTDIILFLSFEDKIQSDTKLSWLQDFIKKGIDKKKFTRDGKFECAKIGHNSLLYKKP